MIGYTVTQIEEAIINTIKNDGNISAYIRTVDRMPIEDRALVKKLIFNYPAMIVMYAGGNDLANYSALDHTGKFTIWCVDKSVRKISDASVGVYQMLNDVLNALHDTKLGLQDVISVISTGTSFEDADEKITIYSRDFEIKWRYQ